MSTYDEASLELHEKYGGKLEVKGVVPITDRETLSTVYTPGVAAPCLAIAKDPSLAWKLTIKGRSVAVVTDGLILPGEDRQMFTAKIAAVTNSIPSSAKTSTRFFSRPRLSSSGVTIGEVCSSSALISKRFLKLRRSISMSFAV